MSTERNRDKGGLAPKRMMIWVPDGFAVPDNFSVPGFQLYTSLEFGDTLFQVLISLTALVTLVSA